LTTDLTFDEAIPVGMNVAVVARDAPHRRAIVSPRGTLSFAQFNARCNQFARALRRRGLGPGDAIALLVGNRPEFAVAMFGAMRCGVSMTPINWHLTAAEAAYILDDCEARLLVTETGFADTASRIKHAVPRVDQALAIGGGIAGFDDFDDALAAEDADDLEDPVVGSRMLYTSGTTGRPKGVKRAGLRRAPLVPSLVETAAFRHDEDLMLSPGPLYHAAPLLLNLLFPLNHGVGIYIMERFDAEEVLRLIEKEGITHTQMVPIMFHRMLALPEAVRARYDLSSLRWILHGSAPCSAEMKNRMIAWLGPILHEFFGGTEGAVIHSTPQDWQARPGTVGRKVPNTDVAILDDDGRALAPGEIGRVFTRLPDDDRFEYFKAPDKTAANRHGDYFTMGDLGYLDADGYLFLTGRNADTIISGGVNIYPAEAEAVLHGHPAIADIACIGVANEEWGEEVKAVAVVHPGVAADEALARALIAFCRERLAGFKCPRSVSFVDELPRSGPGKVLRRELRDLFAADRNDELREGPASSDRSSPAGPD
jgi:long-chain acyl-CoA synthetase